MNIKNSYIPVAPPRAWHGFLMGLGAYATYNIMDIFIKKLSRSYSVNEILFLTAVISLPLMYVFARWRGGPDCMHTRAPRTQILRGILFFLYSAMSWYGLQHLPLADFYTFIFTTPVFTVLFAVLWLKERVTLLQIGLMLISFAGVIVAFHPNLDSINTPALVVLGGTVAGGLGQAIVRRLSGTEGLGASIIYPEAVLAILALSLGFSDFHWPDAHGWLFFAAAGFFAAIANSLLILAFYAAPASQVTPTQYSQIIWGTLYGFLFFGDVPDGWIIAGAGMIIFAGIWLARLEYRATH